MAPEIDASLSTTVAWNWVLEALADIKECDFLTLAEIINSVDGVLKDPIIGAAAARERVALRFLEECVDLRGAELPSPSVQEKSHDVVFDVNERSESILCRFLQKVNNLDSKEMPKYGTYIRGLQRFICEKKSTLPAVFLSTLKDVDILHEFSPSLMGDIGVAEGKFEDISVPNAKKNWEENLFELPKDAVLVRTGSCLVDNPTTLQNDLTERQKHSSTETSLDGHGDPIAAKDDVHPRRHAETLKSFDLRTSGYQGEPVNVVRKGVPSPKLHACCSVQATTSPNLVDAGRTSQNNLSEHHKHFNETALDDQRDPIAVEDDTHPRREAETSKSSGLNTNSYQDKHVNRNTKAVPSSNMHVCSPEVPDKEHDVLSDGDGSPDMQNIDKIHFMEKHKILISQRLSNHHLQKGSCIKCGKGGELLICTEYDYPIAVHGSCLGLDTGFGNMGNFVCPLCSYMRAADAYYDSKERYLLAEKDMLALTNLGTIERTSPQESILSKNTNGLKKPARQSPTNKDHAKQDNNELYISTLREKTLKTFVDNNTTNNSGQIKGGMQCVGYQHKVSLQNTDVATNCGGLVNASNHTLPVNGGNNRVNDAQCPEIEPCQEIGESPKLSSDNLAYSREDVTKDNARDDLLNKHGGEGSNRNDRHKNKRELRSHVQEEATISSSNHSTFEEMVISEQSTKKRKEDVLTPKRGGSSSKCKSSNKRAKRYANPVLPCGRRKKLLWTMEEEEVLKEAMQKFPNSSKGGFPWTRILEHGRHVFHRTRLPMDLRVKWRNIQKRNEKALVQ